MHLFVLINVILFAFGDQNDAFETYEMLANNAFARILREKNRCF